MVVGTSEEAGPLCGRRNSALYHILPAQEGRGRRRSSCHSTTGGAHPLTANEAPFSVSAESAVVAGDERALPDCCAGCSGCNTASGPLAVVRAESTLAVHTAPPGKVVGDPTPIPAQVGSDTFAAAGAPFSRRRFVGLPVAVRSSHFHRSLLTALQSGQVAPVAIPSPRTFPRPSAHRRMHALQNSCLHCSVMGSVGASWQIVHIGPALADTLVAEA